MKKGVFSTTENTPNGKARPALPARLLLYAAWAALAALLLYAVGTDALARFHPPVRLAAQAYTETRVLPAYADENESAGKMDINQATSADLQQAKGIGPAIAQAILEAREAYGGFRFMEELMNVKGVGEARLESLKALFYCPARP